MTLFTLFESAITTGLSLISSLGSIFLLVSYRFAAKHAKPKINARLIRNLAVTDFIWFSFTCVEGAIWLSGDPGKVPDRLCWFISPVIVYMRMSSLFWTATISYQLLQSTRNNGIRGPQQNEDRPSLYYVLFVNLFSFPSFVGALVKQHTGNSSMGCSPTYENLGDSMMVVFLDVIPITLGFLCNLYVCMSTYSKMSSLAYPQSVRKRRCDVMYSYVLVCILCWCPTQVFYILELSGVHIPTFEIIARGFLYSSGFLNALIFGLQDPFLRAFFHHMLNTSKRLEIKGEVGIKIPTSEKIVMFQEDTFSRSDMAREKNFIFKHNRLSKEERVALYHLRPDLNLREEEELESVENSEDFLSHSKHGEDFGDASELSLFLDGDEDLEFSPGNSISSASADAVRDTTQDSLFDDDSNNSDNLSLKEKLLECRTPETDESKCCQS